MARNIFIVNATQVVTSAQNPQGLFSVVSGYPKNFDSRSYPAADSNPNGNSDAALRAAKAEYYDRLSKNYSGSDTRVMSTVTLETAQGRTILSECIGEFPDMTPQPDQQTEPTPEQETEPEEQD